MRLVRLDTLRGDAKLYANQVSSAFFTDANWARLINQAGTELWDLLLSAGGHERAEVSTTVATSVNSAIVAFPQDCYKIITIIARWGSQQLEELPSLDHLGDQVDYRNWNYWQQYSPKAWRARGNPAGGTIVEFFPTPNAVTTLEIRYLPPWTDLVNDADTFDGDNGFEKIIALRAAMEALTIQALPSGGVEKLYEREKDRIEGVARDRAVANPPTIRDVVWGDGKDRWWRRLPWPMAGG